MMKKKGNSVNTMQHILLLCVLGLHIYEAAGQDKSTQMYYVNLTIEDSAIGNVTKNLLRDFSTGKVAISNLKMTTSCALEDRQEKRKECKCNSGHVWSQKACDSDQCCSTQSCTNTAYTCTSNTTVVVKGSLQLDSKYQSCLGETTSVQFKECNANLIQAIKAIYSTVDGFEALSITKYRVGSVIADFLVVIVSNLAPSVLQSKSLLLTSQLNASLNLETTGVVRLTLPKGPVNNGARVNVICTTDTDLQSQPEWQLNNYFNKKKDIHNGTESTIITTTLESTILLTNVSKLWKGQYICTFLQSKDHLNISHKATAFMDVCDSPYIHTWTEPGFPRCIKPDDLLTVTASCEVEQNYEVYNVTWEKTDIQTAITPLAPKNSTGTTIYSASTVVSCDASYKPQITCVLKNRCNQTNNITIQVNIIYATDKYCKAEGDWKDAKAGYEAVMKCKYSVGNRKRQCQKTANWDSEKSFCVNNELSSVLYNADIVDIGLGKLSTNVDNVFTLFQSATNNSQAINSAANIEASVSVLDTMKNKLQNKTIDNENTINEFLRSSSNLLDKTLNSSWSDARPQENKTLGEKYLSSVELLIRLANVTKDNKGPNLEVVTCDEKETPKCNNTVFNATVTIDSKDTARVKTAGFLQLEQYLPNRNANFTPNSILVSTTIQNDKEDIDIEIDFQLFTPRPRNTELKCVYWDAEKRDWSGNQCNWVGDSNKGRCQCTHLSSFAILMSKTPLTVPFLDEITYFGLSVSIVSLIICLVTELIIWSDVVKTDTLYLRHCAHVNISVCLLVGDVCFLASALPGELTEIWCKTFVVLEHFCYLAMFFWMFCLSSILLHKTVYVSLHGISKTVYLRYSIIVGYICPLLIVVITFIANGGEEGRYYSKDTRWLVYSGMLKGSIFTFILPVGIIVFANVFFMCLVIMKLLQPIKAQQMLQDKEKNSSKTVIRSVILLTPVFGLTWGFGFVVIITDLTSGIPAYVVNYIFTIMNAFQGLFIFLTTCAGDRMVREGLQRYFRKKTTGVSSISNSTITLNSSIKK